MPPASSLRLPLTALLAFVLLVLALSIPTPASAAAPPLRGVNVDVLYDEPDSDTQRQLDLARDLGANVVRIAVDWSALEPERKGAYTGWYQQRLDQAVAGAAARDMKVLMTPVFSPCWASSAPPALTAGCTVDRHRAQNWAPRNARDYGDLVGMLVKRYRTRLAALEAWNEPNLPSFMANPSPARAYVPILKAAYAATNAAAPSVPVVAGALSGADTGFLAAMYAAGAKGNYDALSLHPYNDDRSPSTLLDLRWIKASFAQGTPAIRRAQTAAGDRTPIWLSEFGYHTGNQRGVDQWTDGVDPEDQAAWLAQMVRTAGTLSYVRASVLYTMRDLTPDRADPQSNYGLVRRDWTPKPAYAAVRAAFTDRASTRDRVTTRDRAAARERATARRTTRRR